MKKKLCLIFLIIVFFSKIIEARKVNIVRDAEIENFIEEVSLPILKNAEIDSKSINFFLDHQNYVNAFVTGGYNIFLTSSLFINIDNVDQLASVIAHEIGHITGGHFDKRIKASKNSMMIGILSTLLAAGAYAGGSSDAGTAILLGGQHIGQQKMLSFSRNQETFADQTAIRLLENSGYDIQGLYDVLTILEKKEKLRNIKRYSLTHPLTNERKQIISDKISKKKKNKKINPEISRKFKLIKAKLIGYFLDEEIVNIYYDPNEKDLESFYAQSLLMYKKGKIKDAIKRINECIKLEPNNEYFYELKAQILFENGNFLESEKMIRKAIEINSNEKFFNLLLAKTNYHSKEQKKVNESIELLNNYKKKDEFPIEALHYLALCYATKNKLDMYSVTLSEKFLLLNDLKNAKLHLEKAKSESNITNKAKKLINDLQFLIDQKEKNE